MGITNSLEAFKEFRRILNEYPKEAINVRTTNVYGYPLDKIEQDLKVAKILKEKNVDLMSIRKYVQYHSPKLTLDIFSGSYNLVREELTLEEMKLIIEWLKGE